MLRRILAVVAGLAVAVLVVMLVQKLGDSLFPPPADMDSEDKAFMEDYIANLPWGPLAFVIASYVLAALGGGWTAAAIAGERMLLFSGFVALCVLGGATSTMLAIPHPTWFVVVTIIGIGIAALAGASLASGGRVNTRAV